MLAVHDSSWNGLLAQTAFELPEAKTKTKQPKKPKAKTPWPKPLAARIRAVETSLHSTPRPVTAAELSKRFARANAKDVQEILDTLVTLGRAHQNGETFNA